MDEGTIPDPYSLHSDWTTDFSLLLNYTLGDMYAYLIVNEGYDHESLKASKSLARCRLHWNGHVKKPPNQKITFLWLPPYKVQRETDWTRELK